MHTNTPGHVHAVLVEHVHAKAVGSALKLLNHKVYCKVVFEEVDAGRGLGRSNEGALNFSSGEVCCVNNSAHAVAALLGEVQGAVLIAGELRPHLNKLEDACWTLAADNVHSSAI